MIEQGKVIRILPGNQLEVELIRDLGCASCKICLTGAPNCNTNIILENTGKYKPGDTLTIELDSRYFYQAFLLIFILPIVVLCSALYFLEAWHLPKNLVIGASLALFLASYFFAYQYDRSLRRKSLYKILK
jgi:positive regulator of sigma E activity